MAKRPPCGRPLRGYDQVCDYPRMKGKQQCVWHWLSKQPADTQDFAAGQRLNDYDGEYRARVPSDEWPAGERWCSGCQSFVPLFYCSGSRCKACASKAAHAGRIRREYGITGQEYDRLFRLQGGRCFICGRVPRKIRLAVDHDHETGVPRGLLCANNENGCNRAVVANLESSPRGLVVAAKRLLLYATESPYSVLTTGSSPTTWREYLRQEFERLDRAAQEPPPGTGSQPPPF